MAKKPKKQNFVVRMRCVVYKDVFLENCTEEEAKTNPWDYAVDELETDQIDWQIHNIKSSN